MGATADSTLEKEAYSEGVRQLVWKYLRDTPAFKVVQRSPSYVRDWAESQFCLAPQVHGTRPMRRPVTPPADACLRLPVTTYAVPLP